MADEKNPDHVRAMAHVMDEPVSVMLSSGETIPLYSVPPRAMFEIATHRENLQFALQQYQAFQKVATDPDQKLWQKGNRLPYWYAQWIDELQRTCQAMAIYSAIPRIQGFGKSFRRMWYGITIRRKIQRATYQDLCVIVSTYQKLNDIDRLLEAVFGPQKGDEAQKKTP